jgi:hypothetical protein
MIRPRIGTKLAVHTFATRNHATKIQASPTGKTQTNVNAPAWAKCSTSVKRMIKPLIGMKLAVRTFAWKKLVTQIQANLTGKTPTNAIVLAWERQHR